MLNSETGEMEYESAGAYQDRERIYLDKETGEVSSYRPEPDPRQRRSKFLVPKQYLRSQSGIIARKPSSQPAVPSVACATLACKQKMIPMTKEEITVGYNSSAHLIYLLPLLFMTPKLFALIITLVEVILHMWAHRKNAAASTAGDGHRPDVYYRSPMHVVTRNFCEVCRHERLMGRVGKLQDVRLKQMQNYFRKVTRNIA